MALFYFNPSEPGNRLKQPASDAGKGVMEMFDDEGNELPSEEEAKLRQEVAAEVWGKDAVPEDTSPPFERTPLETKEPEPPENPPEEKEKEKEPEEDPWAGTSPALRTAFESINKKLDSLDTIGNRLKQVESRVGGITNEIYNKKTADQQAQEQKEKEAIEAEDEKEWEDIDEEYPELAGLGKKVGERIKKRIKTLEDRLESIKSGAAQPAGGPTAEQVSAMIEQAKLDVVYPENEKIVNTEAFRSWADTQDESIKKLFASNSARDAIFAIDKFFKDTKPNGKAKTGEENTTGKTATQIAEERNRRLQTSEQNTKTTKPNPRPKADDDMTDEEYREQAIKEVWGKNYH